jgi:hypothetical protein
LTGESDTSTLLSGGHVRIGTQSSDPAEIPSGLELGAVGLVSAAFVQWEDDLWLLVPRRRGELSLAAKLS